MRLLVNSATGLPGQSTGDSLRAAAATRLFHHWKKLGVFGVVLNFTRLGGDARRRREPPKRNFAGVPLGHDVARPLGLDLSLIQRAFNACASRRLKGKSCMPDAKAGWASRSRGFHAKPLNSKEKRATCRFGAGFGWRASNRITF